MRPERRRDFQKPLTLLERVLMELVWWLGPWTYRLLCSTYRVRIEGKRWHEWVCRTGCVVGVLWHQRLFSAPFFLRRIPDLALLVSRSKDGEMIRYILESLGYRAVQGSSTRRGGEAYREMKAHLARGGRVGITPDGPRGPARRVQPGAPRLALESGAWILPVTISARPGWFLPSWDRFLFPRPFARVVVLFGEPFPPGQGPAKQIQARIARCLDELTEEADRRLGVKAPRAAENLSRPTAM
jgi:hypothetical protein